MRNFAYGTTCFIAPTFTWQGLRHVGQIVLDDVLAVRQALGLEIQLLGRRRQDVADRLEFSQKYRSPYGLSSSPCV